VLKARGAIATGLSLALGALVLPLSAGCADDPGEIQKAPCCPRGGRATEGGSHAGSDGGSAGRPGVDPGRTIDGSVDASPASPPRGDAASCNCADTGAAPPPLGPIALENQKPGSSTWVITQGAARHEVEGYASATSAAPGQGVDLFINVAEPHPVRWELYRLGYYGGVGGRLVAVGAPFAATPQPPCPADPNTGLVECAWAPSAAVQIADDWVTGQYLFKLVRDDGFESYVPLVVREARPRAKLVYQASVVTWQAYNLWGGASLYLNQLPSSSGFTGTKAYRVSFDRPYEYERPISVEQPETEFGAGHLFHAERWMIQWLEKKGYDVAYVTNVDVDETPDLLAGRSLFLSVGHDEYWSGPERTALDRARDQGVSLGFFSANTGYWRVRLEPATSGAPRRVVTCYKTASLDPEGKTSNASTRFRDPPVARPEDALIGQMYELFTRMDAFPLVVGDTSHWVYEGTGMHTGDTLPHLVGYEWDRLHADRSSPPGVEVVATSSTFSQVGFSEDSNMTAYYPTASSVVFSAGTIAWAWGLGKPGFQDDRVARITENVIARAGLRPSEPTVVAPPAPPTDVGSAARVVLVAGSGVPGYADGAGPQARFNVPVGVAEDAAGNVYVTESRNHRVRKIAPDGTVTTLAGCGPTDQTSGSFADGKGSAACFSVPSGIVVGPNGTAYVADTKNHRVRAIAADGTVSTYAGNGTGGGGDSVDLLSAALGYPRGLALGPDGDLYVVAAGAIRRIAPTGVTTVATDTKEISGVAVAPDGTVYAVSTGGATIAVVRNGALVPLVNPLGRFGDQAGPGDTAMLRPAEGLGVDGDSLVFSDSANYKVRRVALSGDRSVTTLVGSGLAGAALGTGAAARVVNPRGLSVTSRGVLIADSGNHRILRVTP
jgi:hypothetical protein